ncbi:hypothetical protein ANN_23827 [Periplaneta americana]|uniref:Uncharacterized protein n=1 Tax=Periplaneta americana TaxID=6978 RepID=A0ABQ8SM62_PERAM|nr:hypothetical protein ANN_23827 [Periplaneta americana]
MSRARVYEWTKRYQQGRTSLEDGRPAPWLSPTQSSRKKMFGSTAHHHAVEARHITMPKKFRNFTTIGKVMLMLFFESVCLLLCHFMERGESVTSPRYSEILRSDLRRVVKNKRRGRLHEDVIMLHDIARLHTVRHTMDTIRDLR